MNTERVSHYKILSKLGAGGMGEVFLGLDTRLERKVALKFLPASYEYDAERRARFLSEARAASSLRSPNVVAIYDIGQHNESMFIAMEYVEGELLSAVLERGPLDLRRAADITIQVAEALEEAHSIGIVHRDIKSANLIITARGTVKVLDFGLAKRLTVPGPVEDRTVLLGKETSPGVILGTVAYMSPEQARGLEIDERTDLFSLGVLLYEMIAGKQPFTGETTADLLASILFKEAAPLSQSLASVPADIQWIVSKALRKDKELRYQTARDFIVDLRNLEQGLTTTILPAMDSNSGRIRGRIAAKTDVSREKRPPRPRRHRTVDSIAVLPLLNENGDPDAEYFSDGITEGLINSLSRIPKLRVMARSTVFRYKGHEIDTQRVGKELNVRAVMTGRMRAHNDDFSIGAELVDVIDGSQLWGQQYKMKRSEIFSLQDQISSEISETLRLRLNSGERRRLAKRHTDNSEAYELYLKGRYQWSKWSEAGLRDAIGFFEQALKKDPNFALAYCGLGDSYGVLSYFNPDPAAAQSAILKSKDYAGTAVALDEGLAEAHLLLANIAHVHDWQWQTAETEFKRALGLNSNLAGAHLGYSMFLMDQRLIDQGLVEMEMAMQLDPLSLPVNASLGFLLFCAKRYDDAITQLELALQLDPEFRLAHQLRAGSLERSGNPDEAVAEYVKMLGDSTPEIQSALTHAYADSGMKGFWRAFADNAPDLATRRIITPVFAAGIFAAVEQNDEAFDWLDRAFTERAPALCHIKVDPRLESLQSDPRFADLLRRMDLV